MIIGILTNIPWVSYRHPYFIHEYIRTFLQTVIPKIGVRIQTRNYALGINADNLVRRFKVLKLNCPSGIHEFVFFRKCVLCLILKLNYNLVTYTYNIIVSE